MNETPMIRLDAVRKRYGEFSASIGLSIMKGELVSILGPSGSGKTTTLRLIAGFERPDAGRILIDGTDVTGLDPARRRIGFVFQDYTLFPHMNVRKNIGYGLSGRGIPRTAIGRRAEELLRTVGLSGYGPRRIQTLSGGEQQRVAIARALATGPLLLLLDEPFSSIDAPLRKELREEIVRLRQELGVTTVFVTHSRQEALSISDRVAVMREGRIVQFDTPEALYTRPADRFTASFVGDANFIEGRVTARLDGALTVKGFAEFTVRDRNARRDDREARGGTGGADAVTIMVRPNRLRFASPGAVNGFDAVITGCRYFGHYREYRLESAGGPFTVYDQAARSPGERCTLAFEPEDAVPLSE